MVKANNPLKYVDFSIKETAIGPAIIIDYPKGKDKFKEAVAKW